MFSKTSNATSSSPLSAPTSPLDACFLFRFSYIIFLSFSVTNVIALMPLCLSVWILGLRRRCWRRSNMHSDVFTYHLVAMEMVSLVACMVYIHGFWKNMIRLLFRAMRVYSFTSFGQVYFHILTCLDRYVAVVHPIVYLRLKERGGVRIRNALIASAWLLFFLKLVIDGEYDNVIQFFYLPFSIAVVSFCNFAVLYVLMRPPPGERVHVSQSKRRAFNTIMVILSVLLFRIVMQLTVVGVYESNLSQKGRCAILLSGVFFSLPSSLVLPLLFLYRAKVMSNNKNSQPVTATSS